MKHDFDSLYEGPRQERRVKRKKYNRILNILIGFVVVLIVYFGSQLFFGNDDNAKSASDEKNQTQQNEKQNSPEDKSTDSKSTTNDDSQENQDEEKTADSKDDENLVEDPEKEDVIVSADSPDENVLNTVVNPSWKPVGTVQSEPHVSVYKEGSVDWDEMMKAVNYATGLSESNYVVWWNGRDGDNKSVITIENKDGQKFYRVSIEWVENEGWKPAKVEELKENDKAQ